MLVEGAVVVLYGLGAAAVLILYGLGAAVLYGLFFGGYADGVVDEARGPALLLLEGAGNPDTGAAPGKDDPPPPPPIVVPLSKLVTGCRGALAPPPPVSGFGAAPLDVAPPPPPVSGLLAAALLLFGCAGRLNGSILIKKI